MSTSSTQTFAPAYGRGVTVAPSSTSASTTFITPNTESIVVTNLSDTITSYVRTASGSTTATTADYPVLPNTQVSLTKDREHNVVAYVTASGVGSLHIIPGRGM